MENESEETSFEQLMDKLEECVSRLERGGALTDPCYGSV